MILTSSTVYSQDTTVITREQQKEAIRNAQRVLILSSELKTSNLKVTLQNQLIESLKEDVSDLKLTIELKDNNYELLNSRYEALQLQKTDKYNFLDFLYDAAKVVVGVAIGIVIVSS